MRKNVLGFHLGRVELAIGIVLAALQTAGSCECGENKTATAILPRSSGPDGGAPSLPTLGTPSADECATLCTEETPVACRTFLLEDMATMAVECTYPSMCGAGRRPRGLVVRGGEMLARWAALEAASVDAFLWLERDLEHHGAPVLLRKACRRAAADEHRHARAMSRLARRAGARPCRVSQRPPSATRSLQALALENATEGCIGETWGALLARLASRSAPDEDVRAVMRQIADDEARHAAISGAIHEWLASRLSNTDRARIAAATQRRLRRLVREAEGMAPAPARGLPGGAVTRSMAEWLSRAL